MLATSLLKHGKGQEGHDVLERDLRDYMHELHSLLEVRTGHTPSSPSFIVKEVPRPEVCATIYGNINDAKMRRVVYSLDFILFLHSVAAPRRRQFECTGYNCNITLFSNSDRDTLQLRRMRVWGALNN